MLCLAVKALGSKNVTAILMPDIGTSSKESVDDSILLAKKSRVKYQTIEINSFIKNFKVINSKLKLNKNLFAIANAKARTRMSILYYLANIENALVIGTSDKSETALGYTTKYGDNASDILVIADLWKTEVIELGKFLGVPEKILKKKPSAELIAGQDAQKELGANYETLDKILKLYIEQNFSSEEIIKKGFNEKIVKSAIKRVRINEHKRRTAPIIRLSEKSFHNLEWRMPITNGFGE